MGLQQNFLDEVFKWCLHSDTVNGIVCSEISSEDIPKELKTYDTILSILKQNHHKTGGRLTIGELQQKFHRRGFNDDKTFERIRQANLSSVDNVLEELTSHIQRVKSIQAYEDFGDNYTKGDKDKAVTELIQKVKSIESIDFTAVENVAVNPFHSLTKIIDNASIEDELSGGKSKMPFFIPPLDEITHGMDPKDTALFILRSGDGKSTILKSIAGSAVRCGFRGLHFQLEGGDTEVHMKYGQQITGISYHDQMRGFIPNKSIKPRYIYKDGKVRRLDNLEEVVKFNERKMNMHYKINQQFDLSVYSYENLGDTTWVSIEVKINEWVKKNKCNPDFIIIDSLDLLYPGDGYKYTPDPSGIKARIQSSAQKIKNAATKYNTRILTSIQTSDIPMDKWNDDKFVITRNHSMGDKNVANAFSYVFSGNRTITEKRKNIARIYIDKLRHSNISKPVIYVATAFNRGKYVDVRRTLEKFHDINDPDFIPEIKEDKKEVKNAKEKH